MNVNESVLESQDLTELTEQLFGTENPSGTGPTNLTAI